MGALLLGAEANRCPELDNRWLVCDFLGLNDRVVDGLEITSRGTQLSASLGTRDKRLTGRHRGQ